MTKPDIEQAHIETLESVEQEEKGQSNAYTGDHATSHHASSAVERSLLWKSSLVIILMGALTYFVAYLDRNSIGNAKTIGMQKSLNLTDAQYSTCVSMFFVGYIICMLPGNIVLRYLPPNSVIGGSIILFGTFCCGLAAAQNYSTVLSLRILIGFAQAFIQGLSIYASLWFKRNELATVSAAYYSAATISGAFSGLISYGVLKNIPAATSGRDPWRWLYIIDGSVALFVGVLVWLLLPNFPDKLKKGKHWLFTAEEIQVACERSASFNTIGARVELKQIWSAMKDLKSWAFVWMQAGIATGVGTVGVFLPSFIQTFGFSSLNTQLFSTIPYACAFVTLIILCYISDRVNKKGVFLMGTLTTAIIGYIILLTNASVNVKIFATCLITSGLYPSVIFLISWLNINTAGFTKRGATWAMAEISGQCFSIMGTHVYVDPPRYVQGHSVILAFLAFALLNVVAIYIWMDRQNKKKERIEAEYSGRGETHPDITRSLEEVHDQHLLFRYIL